MKNRKIILTIYMIIISLVCLSKLDVYAVDACTDSEMARLRELANNVNFKTSYTYGEMDKENEDVPVTYNIEIVNFNEDLKISYKGKFDDEEKSIKSDTTKLEGFFDGDKVTFKIYSYTANLCTDEILRTISVDLPSVNRYYYFNKEKCDSHPDFKYCKEFMDTSGIDFETIDKEFEDYLNPLNDIANKDILGIPIYLVIILGVLVVGGITTFVVITIKKKKKDDL